MLYNSKNRWYSMINLIKIPVAKSLVILTVCFFILSSGCKVLSKNQFESDSSNYKHQESLLVRTETKFLHSELIDQDFEIYISLPLGYFQSDATYPVLFCTDANRNFNLVSNIVNILSFPYNEIPKVLVVGIGYKIKGLEDWGAWRRSDLLPTNNPKSDKEWEDYLSQLSGRDDIISRSGGASKFLAFIREDVIPFVESNYRVSSTDRALIGYSYGGLFTLYALFSSPEIFKRYFAGSPSISWDNEIIFQYEKQYANTHKDLPVILFMSAGSLETESMLENMEKMENILNSRNYPNLKLETHIFENETHPSCYAAAISRALRVIYK